ncbi:glycosyltransferase [Mesorhizobium sp. WSM3873]|uniref:glycosyltransferase n=1 Tax=Mesorhizobium sp. WSM3873 TaxID=1854056 RepID=UPI000A441E81|nr:glycosyltransferase [Mesorhizobium sp. WSM3873]
MTSPPNRPDANNVPDNQGTNLSSKLRQVGLAQRRAAVVHDYFAIRGGGERLALILAQALEADLVYGFREDESYPSNMFGPSVDFELWRPLRRPGIRALVLAWRFSRARNMMHAYSTRIFSGAFAPFAAPDRRTSGVNVFYCHTPPRFLYDQREHFFGRLPGAAQLAAPIITKLFEKRYHEAISRMDVIVANSDNTRLRLRRYLGLDCAVVYPPVETNRFGWRGQAGYYLSTARLSPLKRVDRIVKAFLKIPDQKLIVASGGEELQRLKHLAADASNIEFRGWTKDEELSDLVGNAIATIYLPRDEDFGMSPVESMAAGKPVIGVAEGGLLETIQPGKTGILLSPEFTNEDLIGAVRDLPPERAAAMRRDCEARAAAFTREGFIAAMQGVIDDAWRKARGEAYVTPPIYPSP